MCRLPCGPAAALIHSLSPRMVGVSNMTRKLLLSALTATIALTACGGGGSGPAGGDSGNNGGGGGTPMAYPLTRPPDPVQQPVSDPNLAQLISATAATPLAPVLLCANYAGSVDTLDI